MLEAKSNGSNTIKSISNSIDDQTDDPHGKKKKRGYRNMNLQNFHQMLFPNWTGKMDFLKAQAQVAGILVIAAIGNLWPVAYKRNDNHNPTMFWVMNAALLVVSIYTLKHDKDGSARGVQLLSRPQTEEWKGWMQWAFIMYHYYRVFYVYNEIRVFVSAYVWMTGFGNFLYFDKKKDFSIERMVSMWLRINYFPLLLSFCLNVKLELYYVVPLHTAGFFITMATCYVSHLLEIKAGWTSNLHRNAAAIGFSLLVHVLFYETPAVNFLKVFSDEYFFRFQADKYSAWVGILSGFGWHHFKTFINWCHGSDAPTQKHLAAAWLQRIGGVGMIALWWVLFGSLSDKFVYNPIHPYCFWMPVAGWLMVRNSSKYLCELHSEALEFLGKITLETYVLQFHVFMCRDVQYIPIIIPGSGADGHWALRMLNMLVTGTGFVALAYWARKVTVTTQTTLTDLVSMQIRKQTGSTAPSTEVAPLAGNSPKPGNIDENGNSTGRKQVLKAKMSDLPSAPSSGDHV